MKAGLRILHCLRAPVGGLFRHVVDLAGEQTRRGHEVGVICADRGDELTEARLEALGKLLQLGVHRVPMGRNPGLADWAALKAVSRLARDLKVDILHGHGAKGGAYARLAFVRSRANAPLCFYTPHGGSLHYAEQGATGRLVLAAERRLEAFTDGLLFESAYAAERYRTHVGPPRCAQRIVLNGVSASDLIEIEPRPDALDFVFVGELRRLKGVDVLIEALALIASVRPATATIVGSGPDARQFQDLARERGIGDLVSFTGARPARTAFTMGRTLVLPSRAESLPYVLLEAGAAGLPVIATRVGGIAEVAAGTGTPLIAAGDAKALAAAMLDDLAAPEAARTRAVALRTRIAEAFTITTMADGILSFYGAAGRESAHTRSTRRAISVEP